MRLIFQSRALDLLFTLAFALGLFLSKSSALAASAVAFNSYTGGYFVAKNLPTVQGAEAYALWNCPGGKIVKSSDKPGIWVVYRWKDTDGRKRLSVGCGYETEDLGKTSIEARIQSKNGQFAKLVATWNDIVSDATAADEPYFLMSFEINDPHAADPGVRHWTKLPSGDWQETLPSGASSTRKQIGTTKFSNGDSGQILAAESELPGVELFIPSFNSVAHKLASRTSATATWHYYAHMQHEKFGVSERKMRNALLTLGE